ncbi:MAG: hypothetical protein ACRC1H_16610, partial [Caldilineaceae bacterium]
ELSVHSWQYFVAGWVVPFASMLPAIALTVGWRLYGDPVNHPLATGIVGMIVALLVIVAGWFLVLGPANRARVQRMLREVRSRLLPHMPASGKQA